MRGEQAFVDERPSTTATRRRSPARSARRPARRARSLCGPGRGAFESLEVGGVGAWARRAPGECAAASIERVRRAGQRRSGTSRQPSSAGRGAEERALDDARFATDVGRAGRTSPTPSRSASSRRPGRGVGFAGEELARDLGQDARAVAALAVGGDCAAMAQVGDGLDGFRDDVVAGRGRSAARQSRRHTRRARSAGRTARSVSGVGTTYRPRAAPVLRDGVVGAPGQHVNARARRPSNSPAQQQLHAFLVLLSLDVRDDLARGSRPPR